MQTTQHTYRARDEFPFCDVTEKAHILGNLPRDMNHAIRMSTNLWDYIATTLHHIKKHPHALEDFFDPDVKLFRFFRRHTGDGRHRKIGKKAKEMDDVKYMSPFMIHRTGNEVLVRQNLRQAESLLRIHTVRVFRRVYSGVKEGSSLGIRFEFENIEHPS
jgi:hypothetical protein